ncbi:unnamed protein product [Lactuca virosa]|uniref:Uncharacterized protein n=1 Tax=Lactuca virosa TaxID=75947 RepID=A0AAU9NYV1_9ASTR|nr:unnamed protein product [Lactuca virosa]
MGDNQQQKYGSNMSGGQTSKATVIPAKKKHVSTMMVKRQETYQAIEDLMGDNQQNYGSSNMSGGETSKATVMPANRKHVSTMMAEKTVKVIASATKHIKNKNKINPGNHGS